MVPDSPKKGEDIEHGEQRKIIFPTAPVLKIQNQAVRLPLSREQSLLPLPDEGSGIQRSARRTSEKSCARTSGAHNPPGSVQPGT